ncbi:glycine betaine ABC transporter substrate-binding protein [Nocardiopsis potens]|uniref:glycine betaine ABC transporter substrate-binding protein n=1 Tax=Nocardiopsis potens TaxID=1246458 RepID=UPI0003454023|nr:glycine betaine ABC transporter substrate-binding protein [Nocardiopsis potens]
MRNGIRSRRFLTAGAVAASVTLLAGACGGGGGGVATGPEEGDGGGKEISIGMIPWEEDIAITNLWKVILEEKGYTVTVEEVDVAPTFEGVANGDIDMYMDVWLPTTHGDYWDQYGDKLEELGTWNENASLELTVPSYVEDVDSIEDLKGKEEMFGERIVGIEAGSGLVQQTEDEAIPTYGLEGYELVKSSTPAMLEELETAIKDEEPVLVTLWRPHIAYSKYDLKDLEDPEGAMGEAETMSVVGREGFTEEFPEVTEWMKNFKLDDDQIQSLETAILLDNEDDHEAGARQWLKENPEFLEASMGDDAEGLEF